MMAPINLSKQFFDMRKAIARIVSAALRSPLSTHCLLLSSLSCQTPAARGDHIASQSRLTAADWMSSSRCTARR